MPNFAHQHPYCALFRPILSLYPAKITLFLRFQPVRFSPFPDAFCCQNRQKYRPAAHNFRLLSPVFKR